MKGILRTVPGFSRSSVSEGFPDRSHAEGMECIFLSDVRFYYGDELPLEMHKARIVQRLELKPVEDRARAMAGAGYNTFLLNNSDVFLDMLTDSGTNAMSDEQLAAMMRADDAYAGSETFVRLESVLRRIFGKEYFLPAHQGRACESILSQVLVEPGSVVPMNYHFTTSKAHIVLNGGTIEELLIDEGWDVESEHPFKGNMDTGKLEALVQRVGADRIPFVRLEAGTNLIGGQPFSLENLREVGTLCRRHGIMIVLDASLLGDNLYLIKRRESACADWSIEEIMRAVAEECDVIYFSARKLGAARGGGMCLDDADLYLKMRELIPLYEGFLTYGGMSVREMEALAVGLEETLDEDAISQGPEFTAHMVEQLRKRGIPVVVPAGGLGCHVDALRFLDHVPQEEYPAGALATAFFIASGVRGMERGTMSEQREEDGSETLAHMELLRLALPRRVFTVSQVGYVVDRLQWLYENRELIGGLRFVEEPDILRFFFGKLEPMTDWPARLVARFREDFGDTL